MATRYGFFTMGNGFYTDIFNQVLEFRAGSHAQGRNEMCFFYLSNCALQAWLVASNEPAAGGVAQDASLAPVCARCTVQPKSLGLLYMIIDGLDENM